MPERSFEHYKSKEFVDLWRSDKVLEAARVFWRQRLLSFLPFEANAAVRVMDLGTGTGALTIETLKHFPNGSVTCVDFSEAMLSYAKEQLSKYADKVFFLQRDLRNPNWTAGVEGCFDAVVSSFLTHTLLERAEALYREVYGLIKEGGCFLSCDFYVPPGAMTDRIYHRLTLEGFQARIKMQTGAEKSIDEVHEMLCQRRGKYRAFLTEGGFESTVKHTVFDHLAWLKNAGFDEIDCLMKYRNNAVIGGFRHPQV